MLSEMSEGPKGKMISIERPWPYMDLHHFGVTALIRLSQVFRDTTYIA
jgi:hypothetical protein